MALDDFAIVVGIKTYPGLRSLEGPCFDADAFIEWLKRSPDGGAVPDAHIYRCLTTHYHPPGPEDAAHAHPFVDDIDALFREFVVRGSQGVRIGRRLYLFFAGHGFADSRDMNTAAVYAANAEVLFPKHVAGTAYAEWFRRNGVFEEVVLIMDCCRSTSPIQSYSPPMLPNVSRPSQAARVRKFYAYATQWSADARERPIQGKVRGIFTTALLEALQYAPPNQLGRVTGRAVKNYIHNTVHKIAEDPALPPPEIDLDEDRDIVWIEREAVRYLVRIHLRPFEGTETLLIQAGYPPQTIERMQARSDEVAVRLVPGIYKTLVEDSTRATLFEVIEDEIEITL